MDYLVHCPQCLRTCLAAATSKLKIEVECYAGLIALVWQFKENGPLTCTVGSLIVFSPEDWDNWERNEAIIRYVRLTCGGIGAWEKNASKQAGRWQDANCSANGKNINSIWTQLTVSSWFRLENNHLITLKEQICDWFAIAKSPRHTPVPGRDNDMSKLNLPPVCHWQYLNFGGLPEVAPHLTPRRQGCLEFCQNSTNVRQWFEHFTLRMASNPQTGRKWPLWGLGVSKTQTPDKHHDIASRTVGLPAWTHIIMVILSTLVRTRFLLRSVVISSPPCTILFYHGARV